jgi:hypothetical protein
MATAKKTTATKGKKVADGPKPGEKELLRINFWGMK